MALEGRGEVALDIVDIRYVVTAEAAVPTVAVQRQADRIAWASNNDAELPGDSRLDEQMLGIFGVRNLLDGDNLHLDATRLARLIMLAKRIVFVIAADVIMDQ